MPGGHIAEQGWGKKFVALSILCRGGLSMLTSFVTEAWQLMGLRFLLGVAEGGVWPAILVIIAKWFPAEERARANALFIMNINIAILVTNPISGWIIQNYGWRNVFIIEGIVSVLLILIWWPLIDERPQDAKWISREEREYIVSRIGAEEKAVHSTGVTSYKDLFADANLWKLTAFYFFFQVGDIGFTMWLPTITKNLVQRGMTMVGLLSAVPFLAAMAGLYIIAVFPDRSMKRKLFLAIPANVFAAALVASVQTRDLAIVAYIFLVVCGLFHNAYNGVFWGLPGKRRRAEEVWLMTCRTSLVSAATSARSRVRTPRSRSCGRRNASMGWAARVAHPARHPTAAVDRRQAKRHRGRRGLFSPGARRSRPHETPPDCGILRECQMHFASLLRMIFDERHCLLDLVEPKFVGYKGVRIDESICEPSQHCRDQPPVEP